MIPYFGHEETNAVAEYMNSGGFITEFRKTTEFESVIAQYVGAKHAIVVNNASAAAGVFSKLSMSSALCSPISSSR